MWPAPAVEVRLAFGHVGSAFVDVHGTGEMPCCGFSRKTRYGKACSTAMPPPRIVSVRRRASVGPISFRQFRPIGWGPPQLLATSLALDRGKVMVRRLKLMDALPGQADQWVGAIVAVIAGHQQLVGHDELVGFVLSLAKERAR